MTTPAIKLIAKTRTLPTKELNSQRKQGLVPAELYGAGQSNQHLFLNKLEAERVYQRAGYSSLVDLTVNNQPLVKVMIKEAQADPLSGNLDHLDLQQIQMDKEMFVSIPLVLTHESKAVKEQGGTLVTPIAEVEISCLPNNLIPHLEIDLSLLASLGDMIRVKDLKAPPTVKIITGLEEVVASVVLQKVEAEPAAAPVTPAAEGEAAAGEAGPEASIEDKERAAEADQKKPEEKNKS